MKNSLIVIMHEPVPKNASPSAEDVLIEANSIAEALEKRGFKTAKVVYDNKNIENMIEKIMSPSPLAVFNLVETIDNSSALCYTVAEILEKHQIPHSGCSAKALRDTTDKITQKLILKEFGVPVPNYFLTINEGEFVSGQTYIIKPISEEGSEGITSKSIVSPINADDLLEKINKHSLEVGFACFAEQYIYGSEYSISLIGRVDNMKVLPPAKMDFKGFKEKNKYEILDYSSKWNINSFEYNSTLRNFDVEPQIAFLLKRVAKMCAKALGLGGYARIDVRLSNDGVPYVIDVNANPCISKDAGFAAALLKAGYEYEKSVANLIRYSLPKKSS